MQGESVGGRHSARRFVLILALAHIAAASFTVGVVFQVGRAFSGHIPSGVAVAICSVLVVPAVAVDVRAWLRRGYSLGLARQTSKAMHQQPDLPGWVTPLFWGLDTGMIWTTFRVTSASWVMLAAALLNVAPQWTGAVYGAGFAVPLVVAVLNPRGSDKHQKRVTGAGVRNVQAATTALLAALPITAALSIAFGT